MAISASSHSNAKGFATYTEYVNFLAQNNDIYTFLANFFNYSPPMNDETTKLNIFDSEGDQLVPKPVSETLRLDCPAKVRSRMIIFQYEEVWTVDRNKLDKLAFMLNIPPYPLWRHLDHENIDIESHAQQRRDNMGPRLPVAAGHLLRHDSRSNSRLAFEHGYFGLMKISAWVLPCQTPSSAKIGMTFLNVLRRRMSHEHKNCSGFTDAMSVRDQSSCISTGTRAWTSRCYSDSGTHIRGKR